jgi:hypothetical protein
METLTESTGQIASDVREARAAIRRAISEPKRRAVFCELSDYEQGSLNHLPCLYSVPLIGV